MNKSLAATGKSTPASDPKSSKKNTQQKANKTTTFASKDSTQEKVIREGVTEVEQAVKIPEKSVNVSAKTTQLVTQAKKVVEKKGKKEIAAKPKV